MSSAALDRAGRLKDQKFQELASHMESALARAHELLDISQIAGGTGSYEWNVPSNTLNWSHNHIRMFGLPVESFDGNFDLWRKYIHHQDLPRVEKQIQKSLAEKGTDWLTEYRISRADTGEERWITSRGKINYDPFGAPLSIVGISIDNTDSKRAEQEMLHHRQDLERRVHERTTELLQKTLEMADQARELDAANANLGRLSARILHLQDDERRRIASHLHDSTGGWVAALAMNLSVLKSEGENISPKGRSVIDDSIVMLREMSDDLRTVSHLLHPPLLDEMGLQSALRWYIEEFSKRSHIPVEIEIDPHLSRLSRDCETVIFRVIQEALTNVHRHSGSNRASICITRQDAEVALEVRDWGKGIANLRDGMPDRPGVGSQGMRERVRQLGGTFEIVSNPDGTSVIAKFSEELVCLPGDAEAHH